MAGYLDLSGGVALMGEALVDFGRDDGLTFQAVDLREGHVSLLRHAGYRMGKLP
jgi:hypothetical protein